MLSRNVSLIFLNCHIHIQRKRKITPRPGSQRNKKMEIVHFNSQQIVPSNGHTTLATLSIRYTSREDGSDSWTLKLLSVTDVSRQQALKQDWRTSCSLDAVKRGRGGEGWVVGGWGGEGRGEGGEGGVSEFTQLYSRSC